MFAYHLRTKIDQGVLLVELLRLSRVATPR